MGKPLSEVLARERPSNILLIRPSALGDVCRTVPVLASLKRAYPDARIDWVVQQGFEDAVRGHPALHRVIPFPRRRVAFSRWHTLGAHRTLWGFLGSLRSGNYDLVVDAQGLVRSGIFARWTGARVRVGYRDAAELAWVGLTHRVDAPRGMHTVDRMLALVEGMGMGGERDMRLYVPGGTGDPLDAGWSGRTVVVAPTSRWAGKRWADERYAALIERLIADDSDLRVIVVGGGNEREQCPAALGLAAREERVVDQVGKTSIAELMRVIEGCDLLVANDSAALHMAVGFARPAVAMFGPTRTDLVGPYRRAADVIQHADELEVNRHKDEAFGRALMDRITVDEVHGACIERLRGG